MIQLLSVFIAGVGTSLTPCIYPLIPITLAVFGATADVGRARGALLALVYVVGIAVTYTALGLVSAKTGSVFGAFLGEPLVVGALVACLVLLALYTLDLVQLGSLGALQNIASKLGGRGFRGAFIMGAVSGLVAAPCAGPALVVILGIAAASGSTPWGALLLFTYALGMGTIFILLGTFPALLRRVPRSGTWLLGVKFIMACAILTVGFYLAAPLAGAALGLEHLRRSAALTAVLGLLACGVGVWALSRNYAAPKLASAVVLAWISIALLVPAPPGSEHGGTDRRWLTSFDHALAEARATGKIALIDLYADWCAACKELEHKTFPAPEVSAALDDFVTARIDFTSDTPETTALAERYSVVGLPCLLFLDGAGRELPKSRVTGFMAPGEFRAHLDAVRNPRG
jgi:thiol:disulfide interchange protein DsbD